MVSIASYLKQGTELVPLAEFRGPIEDEDYIEGAIELSINGKPVSLHVFPLRTNCR